MAEWGTLDIKGALARLEADYASGLRKRKPASLQLEVETNYRALLAGYYQSNLTIKEMAEAANVSPKRMAEALKRAKHKTQGLTVHGTPRKNKPWTVPSFLKGTPLEPKQSPELPPLPVVTTVTPPPAPVLPVWSGPGFKR